MRRPGLGHEYLETLPRRGPGNTDDLLSISSAKANSRAHGGRGAPQECSTVSPGGAYADAHRPEKPRASSAAVCGDYGILNPHQVEASWPSSIIAEAKPAHLITGTTDGQTRDTKFRSSVEGALTASVVDERSTAGGA